MLDIGLGYLKCPRSVTRLLSLTYSAKREMLDGSNQQRDLLSYASGEATPLSKGRGGFDSLRERHNSPYGPTGRGVGFKLRML